MRDPGLVRGGQGGGNLRRDINRLGQVYPLLRRADHPLAQRLAFDVFGHDAVGGVGLADLVNGNDVRMVERGD